MNRQLLAEKIMALQAKRISWKELAEAVRTLARIAR
jgi:hypothetical protein